MEAPGGERRVVTALFADIKGSTELMEELDPEDARRVIDPALRAMIDAVERYGGYTVQSTGDGIFALFGAPVAHEDHAQRALLAALRMQQEIRRLASALRAEGWAPVQIRVGLNTGEVVVRSIRTDERHAEYTPIGHTANLASRLQALADPGSVVVSEATYRLCAGYFAFKGLGRVRLKGVSEALEVYEATGLGPLRTRLQVAARRGLSKFVGREAELGQLKQALEQAKAGRGQVVAAMGEAGVGKSRLFHEFKLLAQGGCLVLEAYSVSHGKASPYLPVIELLHDYFGINAEDDARRRREKVTGRVLTLDRALESALPYLFALLSSEEGAGALAQMDPRIQRQRTLEAIKRILLRESLSRPVILVFEDLHWVDEGTQALLNLLVEGLANARVLLLVNYRPEYRHEWGNRTYYTQLRLDPLERRSAEQMLDAMLGAESELKPLKRMILERTEGNPFFMEEMVQALFDQGVLARDGAVRMLKPLAEVKVPLTVQGVLASRIDRLSTEQRELLQTLAVLGKEFSLGLIRSVSGRSDEELERMLSELQAAEFIYEQPAIAESEYTFKHGLTQEVAYNSALIERRRVLHARAGQAIEALFKDNVEDRVAELAHHYRRAGDAPKAAEYLERAGRQAASRSAFAEAQESYRAALAMLPSLPDSTAREARELTLTLALGQMLGLTRGLSAAETVETYNRARALSERVGELAQRSAILMGLAGAAITAGEYETAQSLSEQLFELAERYGFKPASLGAHAGLAWVRFYRGELLEAEEHYLKLCALLDEGAPEPGAWQPSVLGFRAVQSLSIGARTAALMGKADAARARAQQLIKLAQRFSYPYDLTNAQGAWALFCATLSEFEESEKWAAQCVASADEHGFPLFASFGRVFYGHAIAHRGHVAEGIAAIRQGLQQQSQIGCGMAAGLQLAYLAEALGLAGQLDDALQTVAQGLQANPQELIYQPHILRVRGELRLKLGQDEAAEADLREAVALAQKMSAKTFELRAATSLARLLHQRGESGAARELLAPRYNWFTEGLDTANLKEVKALLDALTA